MESGCKDLMDVYVKCCEKMQKENRGMSPAQGECLTEKKAYRDCVKTANVQEEKGGRNK